MTFERPTPPTADELAAMVNAPVVQVLAMDMAGQAREIMRFTAPATSAPPTK